MSMRKPNRLAGDHTSEALSAAADNFALLIADWCECKPEPQPIIETAYYRDPETGTHGWMCCKCNCITQTG